MTMMYHRSLFSEVERLDPKPLATCCVDESGLGSSRSTSLVPGASP
jgi:hypothetical protein